jgi:hypothetical protein
MRTIQMNRWIASIAFATLVAAAATARAQIQLRPGLYAGSVDMDFAGTKMSDKQTDCLTADDLKDFPKKALMDPDLAGSCRISNHVITSARVTFDMTCVEGGLTMTSRVEMAFTADSYAGTSISRDSRGRTTTLKLSGKRIGECTP